MPALDARVRHPDTVLCDTLQHRAIFRLLNPVPYFNRKISLIFLTGNLTFGIAPPKGSSVAFLLAYQRRNPD
jgi:hypothetical protein